MAGEGGERQRGLRELPTSRIQPAPAQEREPAFGPAHRRDRSDEAEARGPADALGQGQCQLLVAAGHAQAFVWVEGGAGVLQ